MSRLWSGVSLFLLLCSSALAEDRNTFKVGVLVPLTGDVAAGYGDQVKDAVLLAQSRIKDSNISLVFEDSQCQGKVAVSAAKKLITVDCVKAIIGDVCWTDLIAPITEEAHVVVMSTGSAQSTVRGVGRYVFRLKLDVATDSRELAKVVSSQLGLKKIALIFVQDQWGEGIANNFREELIKNGGFVVDEANFQQGNTDFKTVLLKIRANNPQLIMMAAYPAEVGLIVKQARQLGMKQLLAAYGAAVGEKSIALGGSGMNGLIFLEEFDMGSNRAATQNFIKDFREKYHRDPNLFGAMGYDAYQLLARAVEKCSDNTNCIREYLSSQKNFDGVSGLVNFDDKHDVTKTLTLKTIKGGQVVPWMYYPD